MGFVDRQFLVEGLFVGLVVELVAIVMAVVLDRLIAASRRLPQCFYPMMRRSGRREIAGVPEAVVVHEVAVVAIFVH